MSSLLMGSAASKAKVIFRGRIMLSMPSYIGHDLAAVLMFHQPLRPLAYADQMVSGLTVFLLPHDSLASVLTCVDTFIASYISDATREARAVATAAEAT